MIALYLLQYPAFFLFSTTLIYYTYILHLYTHTHICAVLLYCCIFERILSQSLINLSTFLCLSFSPLSLPRSVKVAGLSLSAESRFIPLQTCWASSRGDAKSKTIKTTWTRKKREGETARATASRADNVQCEKSFQYPHEAHAISRGGWPLACARHGVLQSRKVKFSRLRKSRYNTMHSMRGTNSGVIIQRNLMRNVISMIKRNEISSCALRRQFNRKLLRKHSIVTNWITRWCLSKQTSSVGSV